MISDQKDNFTRVLVLGATGQLGQMLYRAWEKNTTLSVSWQSRRAVDRPGWIPMDILADASALRAACARADVVLNMAGIIPASGTDMGLNTDLALAVQAAAAGTPHLLTSSAAVYGRAGGLCRETDTVAPVAPYGIAKREMERAVLAADGPVTCLRIGNVAGADQILGRVAQGTPMTLDQFPDGSTPRRSYIGPATLARVLADLVRAAAQTAAEGRVLPGILNVAAPGAVEMGALLKAASHAWTPRAAPAQAIAEVVLDTRALSRFTPLDPASGTAAQLVAEWRADQDKVV